MTLCKKDIPTLLFSSGDKKNPDLTGISGQCLFELECSGYSKCECSKKCNYKEIPAGTVGCVWFDRGEPSGLFIVIGHDDKDLYIIQPRLKVIDKKILFGTDRVKDNIEIEFPCEGRCGGSGCDCYMVEKEQALNEYIDSFVEVDDDYEYTVCKVRVRAFIRGYVVQLQHPAEHNHFAVNNFAPYFSKGEECHFIKSATKI